MKNILFVCTGNTCRSPMAACLFSDLLRKAGLSHLYQIDSAGLSALDGAPISENAAAALAERGISAKEHRAKQLTRAQIAQADRIYVMTQAHKQAILSAVPDAADKIRVLSISDPYGGDLNTYRRCLDEIAAYLEKEDIFRKGGADAPS